MTALSGEWVHPKPLVHGWVLKTVLPMARNRMTPHHGLLKRTVARGEKGI
jgi:hypothetical protein